MFTAEDRESLRRTLLDRAAGDALIASAAVTGSAAGGVQDAHSDIDLAFAVADAATLAAALESWTTYMYAVHAAVHHVDICAGAWTYRVFLLANGLQVDLAFVPAAEFRALAPTFRLVFGDANEPQRFPEPDAATLIGMAWLHALHARSAMGRGKLWQAEYMIGGLRDHTLALACLRHGLSTAHGRGFDELPAELLGDFAATVPNSLRSDELIRAFRSAVAMLCGEVRLVKPGLAKPIAAALDVS